MLEETGSGGFVEAEGGEKRDEAKVGKFPRLLEAAHRLIYSKDDVGLPGGVGFDEGRRLRWEITAEENCWVKIFIYWGGSRSVSR